MLTAEPEYFLCRDSNYISFWFYFQLYLITETASSQSTLLCRLTLCSHGSFQKTTIKEKTTVENKHPPPKLMRVRHFLAAMTFLAARGTRFQSCCCVGSALGWKNTLPPSPGTRILTSHHVRSANKRSSTIWPEANGRPECAILITTCFSWRWKLKNQFPTGETKRMENTVLK